MSQLKKLYSEHPRAADFARGYLDYLKEILIRLDTSAIAAFIDVLLEARKQGRHIFFVGNGGSAATASHFANDVSVGSASWERPFRAISLTDNLPVLTALANDYGYEEIFVRQLRIHMVPGDVLVAISASGNSANVVKAVEYANTHGGLTVALTGFDGGKLRQIAQHRIHIQTNKGEYGPVEDVHMILDHLLGAFILEVCRSEQREKK